MKKVIILILIFALTLSVTVSAEEMGENPKTHSPQGSIDFEFDASSVILMEATTGTVIYANNEHDALPPASVTKIMTLLLVAEALEKGQIQLSDPVYISENAASTGGSQVSLEEGETFTVDELIKCTVIASANDAAVALAEKVAGSERAFISLMNKRAKELGMRNSYFENTTGLDDTTTKHLLSAYDIALMSCELVKHDEIMKYSRLWQDSIRNGEFVLTNTNRLVRYYQGCTGLKTGSTSAAGFCVSATAERDGLYLIAVVMGAKSRDDRNKIARELLDYGFANYAIYEDSPRKIEDVTAIGSNTQNVSLNSTGFKMLVAKEMRDRIEIKYDIPEYVAAPMSAGEVVGRLTYYNEGTKIGECSIILEQNLGKITFYDIFRTLLTNILGK